VVTEPTEAARGAVQRWLGVAVRVGFVAVVAGWLIVVARGHLDELRHVRLHLTWWRLALAAPATLAGGLLLPLGWRAMLGAYGSEVAAPDAVRAWTLASASRYLPTGLFAVASRAVLAGRLGVSRALTVWSAVVEFGVLVLSGGVLACLFLPSHVLALPIRVAGAGGGLAALAMVPPALVAISRSGRGAGSPIGRAAARWTARLPPPAVGRASWSVGLYCANSAMRSMGSLLVVASIVPVHRADVALLIGTSNAAAVAGLVSITPAGLGTREAVLVSLLQPRFGLGDAAAIAVALRACDLLWLAVAGTVLRGRTSASLHSATLGPPHA
jgi:hypothetical protein